VRAKPLPGFFNNLPEDIFMNPQKKITRQEAQEQQETQSEQQKQQEPVCEFGSVEEMLRHDAIHTPVPPAIVARLQESVRQLPPPPRRSWWRRIIGDSGL
jgi:hypothetical protein